MSSTPTNINLSDSTPSAKADAYNVEWQGDLPVPDPSSPGDYVRNVSACYRVPWMGGVLVLDDTFNALGYQLGDVDSGYTFIGNSTLGVTVKLPAVPPVLKPGQGIWYVKIKNFGAGTLTIDPNGVNLDGSTSTFNVPQSSGFTISTDGTAYWTTDNFASPLLKYDVFSGNGSTTGFTLTKAASGNLAIVFWAGAVVLPTDYTISGTSFTSAFKDQNGNSTPAQTGDKIYVVYFAQ